jgi:hypothetical protein
MRSTTFVTSLALVAVFAALGCSSGDTKPIQRHNTGPGDTTGTGDTTPGKDDTQAAPDPGTPPDPGQTVGTETWNDGKQITGNITIAAGEKVTIAAGATVTVSAGVAITVAGTLEAAAGATHAKLTGTGWAGIVVASGGTLTADSLDVTGAKKAIWTMAGNAGATYANGTINADQPFYMEAGSTLSITKSEVTAVSAESGLAGTFTASYMTYDKGTNEGFAFEDAAGTLNIVDSTLKGNGGGDYVVVHAAKSVGVSYTTISGSHCPFHFQGAGPGSYTIDHVSDDSNGYGWMQYGSGAGPNTISNSNFRDNTYNIEMTGTNGPVTLKNNFFGGTGKLQLQAAATRDGEDAKAAIPDAKPR